MNYLKQILAFNLKQSQTPLSTGQLALWHGLMSVNNDCSWAEWFNVANKRLELFTSLSRSGVDKARNALKQRGFIDFKTNGTKATSYKIMKLYDDSTQDSRQVSVQDGLQNSVETVCEQSTKQYANSLQNSTPLNKLNKTKLNKRNINNSISAPETIQKPKKETKHKHGKYLNVMLSDTEFEKVKEEFPTDYQERIERMSEYLATHGKKYKNYVAALRTWAKKEQTFLTNAKTVKRITLSDRERESLHDEDIPVNQEEWEAIFHD